MQRNKIRDVQKRRKVEQEETMAVTIMLCHDDFLMKNYRQFHRLFGYKDNG